jgi:hypothetical protein
MWLTGKVLPQFDLQLRICHLLGISLLDFLTSSDISNSIEKIPRSSQNPSRQPRESPKSFKKELVRDVLVAILETAEIPPPTMKEVAQRLGYDRRTIFKHFPDLCRAISALHRKESKALHLKSVEQSCQEVQQISAKLCNDGIYPSETRVSQVMTKPGYFRYKQVRATLQQAQKNFSV